MRSQRRHRRRRRLLMGCAGLFATGCPPPGRGRWAATRGRSGRLAPLSMGRLSVMALYDAIGQTYGATRRADPRIAAAIVGAVGDADTVVNVGAGTGSY